ncbi:O-antigen polymerase [Nitrosococcus oceani ATCC 19707]|uniref:O-antigen polymerase n=2 Tax=Nitrosococcus oceani TaxID=1229 RepID=Q3JDL4_NITOC|nr:O-antigen ligase family protein [Nitrosococcus oceani]ABA57082.1 O-antigen polymerase [Nitrosococcus oceani ATCC 19707]EDZ65593.1 O-Antigen Polymerase family [Nitrosococcus oceani AFC27]KFI20490.1 ligase [Nitrosococcus oceani C-27]GEM19903.1 ligase [Nitrosococcus oceani]
MVVLHRRLQHAFFSWGWLLPTVLPIAQVLGRAVFSILIVLYVLWGTLSLYGQQKSIERPVLGLFIGLLLAFLMSVPGAEDLGRAWHKWLKYLVYSMSFVFTLVALQQGQENFEHLCRAFALAGVGLLVVLYLHLAYVLWSSAEFDPAQQLKEDNLPFLLPFLLHGLLQAEFRKYRILLGVALLSSVLFYTVLSEGRAALLALTVALVCYGALVMGWRLRSLLLPAMLATVALIGMMTVIHVESPEKDKETWTEIVDRISSGRTVLWRQAFVYPPESVITGAGMGNARYAEEALTIGEQGQVRHFHNLFIDAWYETGLLGLAAMTGWLLFMLFRAWRDWRKSAAENRQQIGLLLSASAAILTAAQLGPSYASSLVSVYLMVIFAALTDCHGKIQKTLFTLGKQ